MIMKKYMITIVSILSICSCSEVSTIDDIIVDEGVTLSVDKEALEFDADGGQLLLGIKSNGNWGTSCSATWCTLQMRTGKGNVNVVVEASANTTTEDRSGTISVYNNEKSISVNVSQKGKENTSGVPGSGDNTPPSY